MSERVPTGIVGFDNLIEGGLPAGNMILLAGHPGAGKTTLAAEFIWAGATKFGERGVYTLLGETREGFLRNMLQFGLDFERMESEQKVRILELPITREEGLQANLDKIMGSLSSLNAIRLVIDSFTAMSLALKEELDIRVMSHILYKFLRGKRCISFVIYDVPWGDPHIAPGVEFLADGVIALESYFDKNRELRRTLKILKMRGTNHTRRIILYDIDKQGLRFL